MAPGDHIQLGPITQFNTVLVKSHDEPQQPDHGIECTRQDEQRPGRHGAPAATGEWQRGHRAVRPRNRPPEDATCRKGRPGTYQRHLKIFTAREITSTPTMSEVASSVIIISFIHGLIADTSGGLTDVAVEKAKWK